jgi:hypothetical protein
LVKIHVSVGTPLTLKLKATDDVEARVRTKLRERVASLQEQLTSTFAGDRGAGDASSSIVGISDATLQLKRASRIIDKYSPSKDWNDRDKRDSHRRTADKPTTDIRSYRSSRRTSNCLRKSTIG